jgi:hypothetical protein
MQASDPKWKKVARRVLFEAALPFLVGIAWGVAVGLQKKSWFDGISAFGIAFFFVLALQGQILRINKNVRDEEHATDVRSSFASIKQALDAILKQGLAEPSPGQAQEAPPRPPPDLAQFRERIAEARAVSEDAFGSRAFLRQAWQALEQELPYAAATTAAIAFERALRDSARFLGIDTRRPLGAVIAELARQAEMPDLLERLGTLVRVRNGLVHPEGDLLKMDRAEAEQMVRAFSNGIDYLEYALIHIPAYRLNDRGLQVRL